MEETASAADSNTPKSDGGGSGATDDSLLQTKLNPPLLRSDIVARPQIIERLERDVRRPLTLISAPAGYGKSTIAAQWLQSSALPGVWLSLDERDNDLRTFLRYFVAAVRRHAPKGCRDTNDLLNSLDLPSPNVLATALANDLDSLSKPFILVLDDYHRINTQQIHELLIQLLEHPPLSLHLAILTRRDPPLQISSMRAKGMAVEIREADLQFSEEETQALFRELMDVTLAPEVLAQIMDQLEGWIVGLRLTCLGHPKHQTPEAYFAGLKGDSVQIREYLLQQVLSTHLPSLQVWLLTSSILDRFCAPLCDALHPAIGDEEHGVAVTEGEEFLRALDKANLFIVSLDANGEWIRYHHIFQKLLQTELQRQCSPEEIAALHRRASDWFESAGLIEEALQHAHAAQDLALAANIVERHRHAEMDDDRWYVIARWLDSLPVDLRRQRPDLLLAEAWVAFEYYLLPKVVEIADQFAALVDFKTTRASWLGEYYYFRGAVDYCTGQGETSLAYLEQAHALVPRKNKFIRGELELYLAVARCMTGNKELAIERLNELLATSEPSEAIYTSRLIGGLFFVRYFSGDQIQARNEALRLHALAQRQGLNDYTQGWSFYMEACTYLLANRLQEAAKVFSIAAGKRHILKSRAAVDAIAGLVLTRQLLNEDDAATAALDLIRDFAEGQNDPAFLSIADSCRARLGVLRGELDWALQWACSYDVMPVAVELAMWLEIPVLTQARVLIADASKQNLARAAELLRVVRQQAEACHYVPQVIEASVLQSLLLEKQGSPGEAIEVLNKAIDLAEPGGWIRPFVEPGPAMAGMLARLPDQRRDTRFVEQLLTALEPVEEGLPPGRGADATRPALIEALTNRERDVLALLSQRLYDKEIAAQLSISAATVRTHLNHIYEKLGVKNRRQAVLKSKELGILL